jgi:ribonuclease PH
MRPNGRAPDELRTTTIRRHYSRHAEGSVLICSGDTQVLCTASIEERVPPFLRGKTEGWVTAEYGYALRGAACCARPRGNGRAHAGDSAANRPLRAGDRGLRRWLLRCLQADGGTRTAAITGAYVALVDACRWLAQQGLAPKDPIHGQVAAVSVGICGERPVLDLDYSEDSVAETDLNVVMNDGGAFIELQGTAEGHAFRRDELNRMLDLAERGVRELMRLQLEALHG